MKVFNQIGSKERLFEMFQTINKININEVELIDNEQSNNILINSFNALKNKELNVIKNTVQMKDNESYVELDCVDRGKNKINFVFKVTSDEGNQDGVFEIKEVLLDNFKYDSSDKEYSIDLNNKSLNDFNAKHKNDMFGIVDEYVDFELNITNELSEDADYSDEIENVDINQLTKEKEETGDVMQGGLADNNSPFDYDLNQLLKGVKVEMEHTDNPLIALEIAMDHCSENPNYYGDDDSPENMAQINAEKDAVNNDDELSDVLLGYKPLNVGDEIDENRYFDDELLNVSPYDEISNRLEKKYLSDDKLKYRHDIPDRIKKLIKINFNWLNKIKERTGIDKIVDILFKYDMKLLNY